jgi:hypothetical protein
MVKKMNNATRRLAPILWTLLFVFIMRVIGQMLVATGWQGFLPPMDQWYSGLIPYPWLVVCQIVIIILCGTVCLNFSQGKGFFVTPRRGLGKGLLILGSLYFAIMVIRYILRMTFHPEARWFGGTIPIFLHCVLATFLLIVGNFHGRYSRK